MRLCVKNKNRGVALVLTLILLSVTLVMALAFLAISGHERGSVTTQTDTTTARLAADAGLAAAEAQIAANILTTNNPYNFGLIVSTNYINYTYGFQTNIANPTNVSYFDSATGNYLPGMANPAEFLQALANLSYLPRPPVFIPQNGTNDFRFYLDLNRNGVFDPNGYVVEVDNNNNVIGTNYNAVGDPEWIGVLEHPDQPHGPNNHFIARYAFIAVPAGNSLDLNAIHNQALVPLLYPLNVNPISSLKDGYFRNQGVGSWELNLAAFLADLNTNEWDNFSSGNNYKYQQPYFANGGAAFNDAFVLLANRYAGNYNLLAPVGGNAPNGLFTTAAVFPPFQNNIDAYSDGPLQTNTAGISENLQNVRYPWAGADNTNHFFTPDDLFDPARTSSFSTNLLNAGTNNSTYDRYTFYRMLSQLGTDTAPESGRMNLNYDNLDPYVYAIGGVTYTNPPSETNFMAWTPLAFFTNAADRLLKAYTAQWVTAYSTNEFGVLTNGVNTNFVATFNMTNAFGVTGIPVLVSNRFVYTPAVNRLLQLAANMYDATTASNYPGFSPEGQFAQVANGANYPDIFRPIFTVVPQNGYNDVYITGYTNQNPFIDYGVNNQLAEIAPPVDVTAFAPGGIYGAAGTYTDVNVYGVPWIIGAKKGFPNFNAFSVESAFQLVRKLEVVRNTNSTPQPDIILTNQMYLMNITNYMGLSCWNSYSSNYPGPVDILVRCSSSIMLTNDDNLQPPNAVYFATNFAFATETSPNWPGWNGVPTPKQQSASFFVPLNETVVTLSNAIYYYNEPSPPNVPGVFLAGDSPSNYWDKGIRELPHFVLLMTNRLQVAIIDYSQGLNNGRIVDYVQLGGMDSSQDLNSGIQANDTYGFWDTNYDASGNLNGVGNQISVSKTGQTLYTIPVHNLLNSPGWNGEGLPNDGSPAAQAAFFNGFFSQSGTFIYNGQSYMNTETTMQAPYTPMAFGIQHTTWEANDPLVHYLASDLAPHTETPANVDWNPNLLRVTTDRYQPWGAPPPQYDTGIDSNPNNLSFKDPLVRGSDNWDFPTNKLPTVGWLGRVHRGTPWQTVYLKSTNILDWANNSVGQNGFNTWVTWTGDGNFFDATNASPVEDRLLFDLFTTAFNDNGTRGQLSVNISSNSLAAWSAVFSGVTVFSNNFPNFAIGSPPRSQKPLPAPLEYPPVYTNLVIAPAGVSGNNSALAQIVAGIDQTRATFTNADGLVGAFEHKGDILATPQLAEQSPLLNWNNPAQKANGISDEMYEWLPQQVMSLVRVGTPRYVIYSYGQALKPAPNGVYQGTTPAGTFGMVTNYQVVSEIATRTVLRIETVRTNANGTITVTPPRAVIESFNVLPPD